MDLYYATQSKAASRRVSGKEMLCEERRRNGRVAGKQAAEKLAISSVSVDRLSHLAKPFATDFMTSSSTSRETCLRIENASLRGCSVMKEGSTKRSSEIILIGQHPDFSTDNGCHIRVVVWLRYCNGLDQEQLNDRFGRTGPRILMAPL